MIDNNNKDYNVSTYDNDYNGNDNDNKQWRIDYDIMVIYIILKMIT